MAKQRECKHFIVKHGLDAFEALPDYICRTGLGAEKAPRGFGQVKPDDRWIGFAYTTTDTQEKPLSKVTGFYECVHEARYGDVPVAGQSVPDEDEKAWLIEGKRYGTN